MKRLGVIGTMVWDTIHRPGRGEPVEEWGGIAYALSALEACLPSDWKMVPIIKVGSDLAGEANDFLRKLKRADANRFFEVREPNNRVTLRYVNEGRRSEQLTGGVPEWRWEELGPLLTGIDALYVNFISGWEMSLETAAMMRHGFTGPIYCDLHSLLLGIGSDGRRLPRPLPEVDRWFNCFDVVQLNEDELSLIGSDPMAVAARAIEAGVRLLVVTLGERGAAYFTIEPFNLWRERSNGPVRTERVPADDPESGDPTGCGDVFGATLMARLLLGTGVRPAVAEANRMAGRNLRHRGATNLHYHLRGEIAPA